VNGHVTEAPLILGRVRFLPRDTGERWNQVRSHRWYSQLRNLVRVQKVVNLQAKEMKPEGGRCPEDAVSISGVRPHKDFDVTCKSGCPMEGERISPNDEVLVFAQPKCQVSELFRSIWPEAVRDTGRSAARE